MRQEGPGRLEPSGEHEGQGEERWLEVIDSVVISQVSNTLRQSVRDAILDILLGGRNQNIDRAPPYIPGLIARNIRNCLNRLLSQKLRPKVESDAVLMRLNKFQIFTYVAETYAALQEVFAEDKHVLNSVPKWMRIKPSNYARRPSGDGQQQAERRGVTDWRGNDDSL